MRDFRTTVRALRDRGPSLPEPYGDGFRAEPPSGGRWPGALPPCPLLQEFYDECDGGPIGPYDFLPLEELAEETADVLDWMETHADEGEIPKQGRCVMFARNEYGHDLLWDADRDAVLAFDSDGGGVWDADDDTLADDGSAPAPAGRVPLARFLDRIANPPADPAHLGWATWAEVLAMLDGD